MRWLRKFAGGAFVVLVLLWVANNSTLIHVAEDQAPRLIAHRGVHQVYAGKDRHNDTCTANPIHPVTHQLIANTIPSIEAAFDFGADVVEIDVHLTADSVFAVFHDWTLECQTDGTGVTHEQRFEYLKSLDLGYGYTEDGVTFPLRGSAVGAIPSLSEVLGADLAGQVLINFKSNREEEGAHLADMLNDATARDKVFAVYGGNRPTQLAMQAVDGLREFGKADLKACLKDYALLGWSGYVPPNCRNRVIAIPMDYAPFLWGWPHRFTQRMKNHRTEVILWGPYDGSGFSSGIDDAETLDRVPAQFDGYIWTNRIELIGPMVKSR